MLRSALVMWRLDWTGLVVMVITECVHLDIPNFDLSKLLKWFRIRYATKKKKVSSRIWQFEMFRGVKEHWHILLEHFQHFVSSEVLWIAIGSDEPFFSTPYSTLNRGGGGWELLMGIFHKALPIEMWRLLLLLRPHTLCPGCWFTRLHHVFMSVVAVQQHSQWNKSWGWGIYFARPCCRQEKCVNALI